MPEPYADTLATVAAERTALVHRLRTIAAEERGGTSMGDQTRFVTARAIRSEPAAPGAAAAAVNPPGRN